MSYAEPIHNSIIGNPPYVRNPLVIQRHSPLSIIIDNISREQASKTEQTSTKEANSVFDKIYNKAKDWAERERRLDYLDSIFNMPSPVYY